MQTGYCTNVHAGTNLNEMRSNLESHATEVRRQFCPDETMGVGLWLSAQSAQEMLQQDSVAEFREWLEANQLVPYTFNGFPFGNFHQAVVKHRVYEPTWMDDARVDYTRQLIEIQHRLLPEGMDGSISTLPIGWGTPGPSDQQFKDVASRLVQIINELEELAKETGRQICLCLEPEPGCALQRAEDVVHLFERYIDPLLPRERASQHLRVCHDVCHAAVMFEDQTEVIQRFQKEQIRIGKVQVSSAIRLRTATQGFQAGIEQLAQFAEDRYLHQTMVKQEGQVPVFYEDLPQLLKTIRNTSEPIEFRTHFHVPIYLDQFGDLETTRDEIEQCLDSLKQYSDVKHFEVETYAWGVLPPSLQRATLAEGIAEELRWFRDRVATT